jgi:UDP-N-acetylmuramoyl-tripeptide--D-alanyl-D-alanine ligase
MVRRSVAEAAAAMGGRVVPAGDPEAAGRVFDGAAIDSRRVRGGELFFALPGERTAGHRFVAAALGAGAAAAVVERPVEAAAGMPAPPVTPVTPVLIEVGDSFAALHALTRAVRGRVPERLVGITGSTGKTTTKELLAAMLGRRFRVARNPGNLNNLYGFPVSLLAIPDDTEWMVAEMGMSVPGELGEISRLGRPDAAVFTNVRPVHLEFFADLAAIGRAKGELLEGLAPGGLVVVNADDPEVAAIARRHEARAAAAGEPARVVRYGRRGGPGERGGAALDVAASEVEPAPAGETGTRFVLETAGRDGDSTQRAVERTPVRLALHGLYNVDNCLAAAACAWALGVPPAEIAAAAAGVRPAEHRGVVHPLPGRYHQLYRRSYGGRDGSFKRAEWTRCNEP